MSAASGAYASGRGPSWPCAHGHTSKTAGCTDCVDISGRTTGRAPAWTSPDCGHTADSESGGWHDCPPPTSMSATGRPPAWVDEPVVPSVGEAADWPCPRCGSTEPGAQDCYCARWPAVNSGGEAAA